MGNTTIRIIDEKIIKCYNEHIERGQIMYQGWTLLENINIYLYKKKEPFLNAKIADSSNKKNNEKMEEILEGYPYEIETIENSGFECSISDSITKNYSGSVKNKAKCLITKETLQFQVEITLENLFQLLHSSHIDKGILKEKVFFAKYKGKIYIIHENSPEYRIAKKDTELRQKTKKKTKKREIGQNYLSLYSDVIYLGDIYLWYEKIPDAISSKKFILQPLENPKKVKLVANTKDVLYLLNGSNKLSDFIYNAIEVYKDVDNELETSIQKRYFIEIQENTRPQTKGDIKLINDIDEKDLQLLLNARHDFYFHKFSTANWGIPIDNYLHSAFSNKIPSISKEEKKALKEGFYQYEFL